MKEVHHDPYNARSPIGTLHGIDSPDGIDRALRGYKLQLFRRVVGGESDLHDARLYVGRRRVCHGSVRELGCRVFAEGDDYAFISGGLFPQDGWGVVGSFFGSGSVTVQVLSAIPAFGAFYTGGLLRRRRRLI